MKKINKISSIPNTINKIFLEIKLLDSSIQKTMKFGIKFSFIFCLLATLILATYQTIHIPTIFSVGISLFQTSLFFFVTFIAFGFIFNYIKHK